MTPAPMKTSTPETLKASVDAIAEARKNHGFLRLHQIEAIAAEPKSRLMPILVRCGCGRFTAPAQDVLHFIAIIEAQKKLDPTSECSDYIRDVSLASMEVAR